MLLKLPIPKNDRKGSQNCDGRMTTKRRHDWGATSCTLIFITLLYALERFQLACNLDFRVRLEVGNVLHVFGL